MSEDFEFRQLLNSAQNVKDRAQSLASKQPPAQAQVYRDSAQQSLDFLRRELDKMKALGFPPTNHGAEHERTEWLWEFKRAFVEFLGVCQNLWQRALEWDMRLNQPDADHRTLHEVVQEMHNSQPAFNRAFSRFGQLGQCIDRRFATHGFDRRECPKPPSAPPAGANSGDGADDAKKNKRGRPRRTEGRKAKQAEIASGWKRFWDSKCWKDKEGTPKAQFCEREGIECEELDTALRRAREQKSKPKSAKKRSKVGGK